jgi:hypothetical protein
MPKSNFNQFIDECEDFTNHQTCKNKISFENKQPVSEPNPEPKPISRSFEIDCETKKQYNQSANTNSNTIASSSNIFLSKNVNSRQTRFSMNINGNVANTNAFENGNRNNNSNNNSNNNRNNNSNNNSNNNRDNVNVNMFKKAGNPNDVATSSSSSHSTSIPSITSSIEINNETFPSLAPPGKVGDSKHGITSSSTVPKKFKNFKDAITASAPEPVVPSPTKQKQIKAHLLPPLLIKRESEMLAMAKTKTAEFYDNECDDDDDFDHDNHREYGYSYKHKPAKKQYNNNNNNDDSDD